MVLLAESNDKNLVVIGGYTYEHVYNILIIQNPKQAAIDWEHLFIIIDVYALQYIQKKALYLPHHVWNAKTRCLPSPIQP